MSEYGEKDPLFDSEGSGKFHILKHLWEKRKGEKEKKETPEKNPDLEPLPEKLAESKPENPEETKAEIERLKQEIEKANNPEIPQEVKVEDPRIIEEIKGLTDAPREFGFKERLMNVVSEPWFVDGALQKRAEWFIKNSGIEKYLKTGGQYLDVGTGKGHITQRILEDMEKAGNALSAYYGIDNADRPLKKVQKREAKRKGIPISKDNNPMNFSFNSADALPFQDGSLDGVSYIFAIHHMDKDMTDKVMQEAMRVLKPDGNIFIAEDIVDSEEQRQRTAKRDDQLNWGKGEHNYKSDQDWEKYFDELGLEVAGRNFFESETKKGSIPHGFYVLRKKQESE
ncbi:MAG: class I SAM-dependent methyltransferase [Patescibacteria group bacterium]